jgi:hypothetical protein
MAISLARIESMAPDQAALEAARKLLKPASWPALCADGEGLVWGECQGSGAAPYRVSLDERDAGYRCTCPSRKFPCKHTLALMWMRAEGKTSFAAGPAPDWVEDWQRRRRPGAPVRDSSGGTVEIKRLISAATPTEAPEDPKAEARAAAARDRARREREEAILAGLDDLDFWLADQIDAGLVGFAARAVKSCGVIVRRLVDAKAGGLAARIELLPGRLFALAESARGSAAAAELGQLHLLAEAYRRQESLTPELRADVRREVGWTVTREALLADESAPRCTARWRVVAALSEVQPDRLRRLETWLMREGAEAGPGFAVLVDFVPLATGPARGPYRQGEIMEAELVFYPSPVPLRAQLAAVAAAAQSCAETLRFQDTGIAGAIDRYEAALAAKPWLGAWPMSFRGVRLRRHGERLFLCAAEDSAVALPLNPAQSRVAAPLLSLERFDGVGLWDGSFLRLTMAETALGRWENG